MLSLKADGTFSFSSGASDNGFGYMDSAVYKDNLLIEIAASESEYDHVSYHLYGTTTSEQVYHDAVKSQKQKPDAIWYDLTNENLSSLLEVITD